MPVAQLPVAPAVAIRPRRPRRRRSPLVGLVVALLVGGLALVLGGRPLLDAGRETVAAVVRPALGWPVRGQAAIQVDGRPVEASPGQHPVPIASVTKIMTALVVLERAPLKPRQHGFTITITAADVAATEAARQRDESLVPVAAGEVITEREALLALLLPSANNMARLLAVHVAGSESAFVGLMNAKARALGLHDTSYADASGFDPASVSTAADQTVLAAAAMRNRTFAWLVKQPSADLPVAGRVISTNRLLGVDGNVGMKTGSHSAAGGCFVFAAHRTIDGERRLVVGAVLGQRGHDPLGSAFAATEDLLASLP